MLAADAKRDVGETASIMGAQIVSTIGVPLWHGDDEIIGILQVDNRAASGVFRERDLDILAVLAQSASQAFAHARLVRRLRAAEESQRTENDYLKRREQGRRFDGIIGEAVVMKRLFEQLRKVVEHARHGPHRGRDGHWQGAHRERGPLLERAGGQALRGPELRRHAGEPARERAVRSQEGLLHRRDRRQEGAVRARRRRHALPGRGRRDAAQPPGQAPPRAAGRRDSTRRAQHDQEGRRAHRGCHQPRPREGGRGRALP